MAWGNGYYGQCDIPEPNTDFVAVAAGRYHSLGLIVSTTGVEEPAGRDVPETSMFTAVSVAPNPFNPYTTIDFAVGNQQHVTVAVYDMSGRQVAVLTDQLYAAGLHQADWDGKDSAGQAVASGTYLVRLQTQDVVESRKIMLVR